MQTLLVTVDSLRADHLGQYGYDRDTMPVLDRLTDEGTVFRNAFANGAYTRISIPAFHASRHLAYEDLNGFPTIASVLSNEGIDTAVIGTQTGIGLVEGDFDFDETIDLGRDEFHEEANRERPLAERVRFRLDQPATRLSNLLQESGLWPFYEVLRRPYNVVFSGSGFRYLGYTSAEEVTDRALSWLDAHADTDFFLWVHYMEAHRPYGVHDEIQTYCDSSVDEDRFKSLMKTAGTRPSQVTEEERTLMRDLYDSDLRYCSRHLERLFDGLEAFGIWEDANVLFSSDHGEEFYEHSEFFHRNYPYDVLTHVPLVVKAPIIDAEGEVTEIRQLLDLAPTICALHLPDTDNPSFNGTHLFDGPSRTVVSLGQPKDTKPAVAVRTDEWKYITNGDEAQLYHLISDPDERDDCVERHPDVAETLRSKIPNSLLERGVKQPRVPEDEVDREQLEALGYLEVRE